MRILKNKLFLFFLVLFGFLFFGSSVFAYDYDASNVAYINKGYVVYRSTNDNYFLITPDSR